MARRPTGSSSATCAAPSELLTHNVDVDVDVPAPVNRALHLTREELNGFESELDVDASIRELARSISSAGLEARPTSPRSIWWAGPVRFR